MQRIIEQDFISIRDGCGPKLVSIVKIHINGAHLSDCIRHLGLKAQMHALIGLQTHREVVRSDMEVIWNREHDVRGFLELDIDLGDFLLDGFA